MATVEDRIAAQIRNIEATYGRTIPEWFAIIAERGTTKHSDVVAMLKAEFGMTHGAAHRVLLLARAAAAPPAELGADPTDALYAGAKSDLRHIHDALITTVRGFGDVDLAPKKGYLSLRARKQFAMIQPSTASRVDLGLILPGIAQNGRLEPASGFNALFTHRVRLTSPTDVDRQLIGWLRDAYERAT